MKLSKGRHKIIMSCFAFVSGFAVSGLVYAQVYYVDFQKGSDLNDGASISSPFKRCPGDDNATDNASATILSPGDIVVFKGGVIYKGRIDLDWSGSSYGDRIIYDGDSGAYVPRWGTGTSKAIIDNDYDSEYVAAFYATGARSYIRINNFEIREVKYSAVTESAGIKFPDQGTERHRYIEITNNYIHHIGEGSAFSYPAGNGIWIDYGTHCVIENNEIANTNYRGIKGWAIDNCTISKNNIHDWIKECIDIASIGDRYPHDNIISNNVIHDSYQYDAEYWRGEGDPPHSVGIFLRAGGNPLNANPRNNLIERNLFYNNETFYQHGGTAFLEIANSHYTTIRNNVLINPHSYYAVNIGWEESGTTFFYNNTIYSPRAGCTSFRLNKGTCYFENNIIVGDRSINNGPGVNFHPNYNLYYAGSPSLQFNINGSWYTWNAWVDSGFDTIGSSNENSISDIEFQSTSGYPASSNMMFLMPKETSPAVDRGRAQTGFSDDKEGTLRPQGSAWDLGAYEFLADDEPPLAPVGLRLLN